MNIKNTISNLKPYYDTAKDTLKSIVKNSLTPLVVAATIIGSTGNVYAINRQPTNKASKNKIEHFEKTVQKGDLIAGYEIQKGNILWNLFKEGDSLVTNNKLANQVRGIIADQVDYQTKEVMDRLNLDTHLYVKNSAGEDSLVVRSIEDLANGLIGDKVPGDNVLPGDKIYFTRDYLNNTLTPDQVNHILDNPSTTQIDSDTYVVNMDVLVDKVNEVIDKTNEQGENIDKLKSNYSNLNDEVSANTEKINKVNEQIKNRNFMIGGSGSIGYYDENGESKTYTIQFGKKNIGLEFETGKLDTPLKTTIYNHLTDAGQLAARTTEHQKSEGDFNALGIYVRADISKRFGFTISAGYFKGDKITTLTGKQETFKENGNPFTESPINTQEKYTNLEGLKLGAALDLRVSDNFAVSAGVNNYFTNEMGDAYNIKLGGKFFMGGKK